MAAKSGDLCPACKAGRLTTARSVRCGESHQIRYLRCPSCGGTYRQVLAAADVVRRR